MLYYIVYFNYVYLYTPFSSLLFVLTKRITSLKDIDQFLFISFEINV